MASGAKLLKKIVRIFEKANIVMNQEKAPRDLGVANTAGKRRSVGLVKKRIDKACARNTRIQHLVIKKTRGHPSYTALEHILQPRMVTRLQDYACPEYENLEHWQCRPAGMANLVDVLLQLSASAMGHDTIHTTEFDRRS